MTLRAFGPVESIETPAAQRWVAILTEAARISFGDSQINGRQSVGATSGMLNAPSPPKGLDLKAMDDYLKLAGSDLRMRRQECFARSRQTFLIMVSLAVISLIIFSVTALVTGLSLSAETIAPSSISALLASATAPAWRLYKAENARAAEFDRDLVRLEEIRIASVFAPRKLGKGDFRVVTETGTSPRSAENPATWGGGTDE